MNREQKDVWVHLLFMTAESSAGRQERLWDTPEWDLTPNALGKDYAFLSLKAQRYVGVW